MLDRPGPTMEQRSHPLMGAAEAEDSLRLLALIRKLERRVLELETQRRPVDAIGRDWSTPEGTR